MPALCGWNDWKLIYAKLLIRIQNVLVTPASGRTWNQLLVSHRQWWVNVVNVPIEIALLAVPIGQRWTFIPGNEKYWLFKHAEIDWAVNQKKKSIHISLWLTCLDICDLHLGLVCIRVPNNALAVVDKTRYLVLRRKRNKFVHKCIQVMKSKHLDKHM